jgi:hypothetical protein
VDPTKEECENSLLHLVAHDALRNLRKPQEPKNGTLDRI